MKIALASDHAGFQKKELLKGYLIGKDIEIKDFGTFTEQSCDYPDFGHPLAIAVENKEYDFGISICHTGNGINMTANKHLGIRAALCWNTEIALLARLHNNANVCSLPSAYISEDEMKAIVDIFISTGFEGGRHKRRVDKIPIF
jgi:ribose 5-phosphate isomerase B